MYYYIYEMVFDCRGVVRRKRNVGDVSSEHAMAIRRRLIELDFVDMINGDRIKTRMAGVER